MKTCCNRNLSICIWIMNTLQTLHVCFSSLSETLASVRFSFPNTLALRSMCSFLAHSLFFFSTYFAKKRKRKKSWKQDSRSVKSFNLNPAFENSISVSFGSCSRSSRDPTSGNWSLMMDIWTFSGCWQTRLHLQHFSKFWMNIRSLASAPVRKAERFYNVLQIIIFIIIYITGLKFKILHLSLSSGDMSVSSDIQMAQFSLKGPAY